MSQTNVILHQNLVNFPVPVVYYHHFFLSTDVKKAETTDHFSKHLTIQTLKIALKTESFLTIVSFNLPKPLNLCRARRSKFAHNTHQTHPYKRSEVFALNLERLADQKSIQTQTTTDFVLTVFGFTEGLFFLNLSEILCMKFNFNKQP